MERQAFRNGNWLSTKPIIDKRLRESQHIVPKQPAGISKPRMRRYALFSVEVQTSSYRDYICEVELFWTEQKLLLREEPHL